MENLDLWFEKRFMILCQSTLAAWMVAAPLNFLVMSDVVLLLCGFLPKIRIFGLENVPMYCAKVHWLAGWWLRRRNFL